MFNKFHAGGSHFLFDLIPIDSLYSPIRQVSYRVGAFCCLTAGPPRQAGRGDKLSITVETDGTVTPEDAVAYAVRILQDQLTLFVHFEEGVALPSRPMIGPRSFGAAQPEEGDANQLNQTCSRRLTSSSGDRPALYGNQRMPGRRCP